MADQRDCRSFGTRSRRRRLRHRNGGQLSRPEGLPEPAARCRRTRRARRVRHGSSPSARGRWSHEIVALRDELGLSERRVADRASGRCRSRVMTAFDVFTLASKYEGLPVALMQALALGLPMVATRVGGIAEVLTDDEAILVPSERTLSSVRRMGEGARVAGNGERVGLRRRPNWARTSTPRSRSTSTRPATAASLPHPRRRTRGTEEAKRALERTTLDIEIRPTTEDRPPAILELCRSLARLG
jgi:hypothetical protein